MEVPGHGPGPLGTGCSPCPPQVRGQKKMK